MYIIIFLLSVCEFLDTPPNYKANMYKGCQAHHHLLFLLVPIYLRCIQVDLIFLSNILLRTWTIPYRQQIFFRLVKITASRSLLIFASFCITHPSR